MMFSDKIDTLMKKLNATNTEIGIIAGIDRTNLTNFRNGRRLPRKDGEIIDKVIHALYDYASSSGRLALLCKTVGLDKASNSVTICSGLKDWLYMDTPDEAFLRRKKQTSLSLSFCDRFDKAMSLAGTTNGSLGKIIHVDSSLIRHYRSGIRTPSQEMALSLSDALFDEVTRNHKLDRLADLMQTNPDSLDRRSLHEWLYAPDRNEGSDNAAMKLLETFDSYQSLAGRSMPEFGNAVASDILLDRRTVYYGADGLHDAVLRFLACAGRAGATEMYLYSDQDMQWMMSDTNFNMKWTALMCDCIKKGIHIHIIHNIDRDLGEMSQAITSWIPLYMSGMIKSYYHTKKNGERFSHTFFYCPEVGCISGFHIKGAPSAERYHYYVKRSDLAYCHSQFDALMSGAKQLVRIEPYIQKDLPKSGITVLGGSGAVSSLRRSPYRNMSVVIGGDGVRITHTIKPYMSFIITHPLMKKAFLAYAERLDK